MLPPERSYYQVVLLIVSVPLLIGGVWLLTHEFTPPRDSYREKRRGGRTKNNAVFDLEDGKGNFTRGNAQLVDISPWGACISTTVSLEIGQQIRARVRSAEGMLRVSGRVVWMKKKRGVTLYGVSFQEVTRLSI